MYDVLKSPIAQLVKFQRDLCNKLATDAKKSLDRLVDDKTLKLGREAQAEVKEAFRKYWLVSKGMPHNKLLKRMKEDPEMRAEVDAWDVYDYGEQNKEEKAKALSELYIIVDERSSEYELTDKGIHLWA